MKTALRARQGARGCRRGRGGVPRIRKQCTPREVPRLQARGDRAFCGPGQGAFTPAVSRLGPITAPRRPIRSSSSACLARDRPWSINPCPAIPTSRGQRTSRPAGRRRRAWKGAQGVPYPDVLADLGVFRLHRARRGISRPDPVRRKTAKPFSSNKTPNNWAHKAHPLSFRREDRRCRRHPLGCGVSNFRNISPKGRVHLLVADIGHYYRDYVRLLRHFDEVLPGRLRRVTTTAGEDM